MARTEANFLAFHVEYWDYIGWADRFASPEFAARQRARVAARGGNTVYTPQVMVGSHTRVRWHDAKAFQAVLAEAAQSTPLALEVRVRRDGTGLLAEVAANWRSTPQPARLWLARYVDAQQSRVKAGENVGTLLKHDRVVTELFGPWPLTENGATQTQRLSPDHGNPRRGLTAFVQTDRGITLQSLSLQSSQCDFDAAGKD